MKTIEEIQQFINKNLKNSLGRYNSRCLAISWFEKNSFVDYYSAIEHYTNNIKNRTMGEKLWAIENYPIPLCGCGKPVKRYDNEDKWSLYCSAYCATHSEVRAKQISETKLKTDSTESNEKRKTTMQEMYGYDFNTQRPEVRQILSEKQSKNQLAENTRTKLMDNDWLIQEYEIAGKSASQIGAELGCDYSTVIDYLRKNDHTIRKIYNRSLAEIQIEEFIKSLGVTCYPTTDILKDNREIDIYIPDYNIGIEMNGLRYHSNETFETTKEKHRHLNKTIEAKENNIQLIHILDHQWINQKELCKSFIKNLLGKNEILGARKCQIKLVDKNLEKKFLNNNHFQGFAFSKFAIGLFLDSELISIMTFCKPRYNKNYDWELLRFCNKMNINVVGGFSKLLNNFVTNNNGTIISYADKQRSNGNVYEKNGFVLDHETSPGYFWTNGTKIFSRIKCQKHKLKDWLPNFDENKSEAENMFANKFRRYWDCGQLVYCLS